jgi:hypothetical protein
VKGTIGRKASALLYIASESRALVPALHRFVSFSLQHRALNCNLTTLTPAFKYLNPDYPNILRITYDTRRKISGFHGGDYEECRLLKYKNPVRTSQETHYVSATEISRLILCTI